MNAAEVAYARLLLVERSDEGAFGLRLLARIEKALRARQVEREQELLSARAATTEQGT